jgi:hypothetical protein
MKKIIVSLISCFFMSAFVMATNNRAAAALNLEPQQTEQKNTKSGSEVPKEKYDYSLFKFLSPAKSQEQDTLKKLPLEERTPVRTEETTYDYERPRAFLMFS